jgi:glycosyltransferase involved in cell wall biosynthesis
MLRVDNVAMVAVMSRTAASPEPGAPSRVALFLPDLPVGGVETVMLTLASGLHARGFIVDLVVASTRGAALRHLSDLQLVDLHARRTATALMPLARYLRRARPAALISAKDHANLVALAASRVSLTGTPVVVTVHGAPSDALASPERWTGHVVRRVIRRAYPHAASVVAVSDGVADDLRTILGTRAANLVMLPNPVITPDFLARAETPLDQPWLARSRDIPVIVWCGRLTDEKDPHTAVAAFAALRRTRAARLIVLGDGPLRGGLEARVHELGVADDVFFAGFVREPAPFLARADAFLLSSRREGLPTALIEALAVGTPVVATDCPTGPAHILDRGRLGSLVPVADPAAMAEALAAVLDHAPEPATETDLRPYNADTAVDRYVALLKTLT